MDDVVRHHRARHVAVEPEPGTLVAVDRVRVDADIAREAGLESAGLPARITGGWQTAGLRRRYPGLVTIGRR